MASFDLVYEPWIPCVPLEPGSERIEVVGLRQLFERTHEFREIYDPSPLIVGSLHRLLLAILHRSLNGPKQDEDWIKIWDAGRFNGIAEIGDYLERWSKAERFDLFHADHPFYQTPGITTQDPWATGKLFPELDASLFDHTQQGANQGVSPAAAARALVAMQSFALGGLVSFEDPNHRSADGAPLANCALILLRGKNLFETLTLNLHRYDPPNEEPCAARGDDKPAWEMDDLVTAGDRPTRGYIDWLTWPSRRLLLSQPEQIDDELVVKTVVLMKGAQLDDLNDRRLYETMVAFRAARDAKEHEAPYLPVKFDSDRALWRDFTALCQSQGNKRARPRTFDWISNVASLIDPADRPPVIQADALGMLSDRALKLLWRSERFDLPLAYLEDDRLTSALQGALEFANIHIGLLFTPGVRVGRDGARYPRPLQLLAERLLPSPGGAPDKNAVAQLIESLGMERRFWPQLETPFRTLVIDLPDDHTLDPDNPDFIIYGANRLPEWAAAVKHIAFEVFDDATRALGADGRTLRAVAPARQQLRTSLYWAEKRYLENLGLPIDRKEPQHDRRQDLSAAQCGAVHRAARMARAHRMLPSRGR